MSFCKRALEAVLWLGVIVPYAVVYDAVRDAWRRR